MENDTGSKTCVNIIYKNHLISQIHYHPNIAKLKTIQNNSTTTPACKKYNQMLCVYI